MITERVHFRLILMPCCGMLYCHINPRLPNYCPECGARCYAEVKSGTHTQSEFDAWLSQDPPARKLNIPEPEEGMTALQEEISIRLHSAHIPDNCIEVITYLVAVGEQARQNREEARLIDELAEAHERYRRTSEC